MPEGFANTPEPPYYAVIFTSRRTEDDNGYDVMASAMSELALKQPGCLGVEHAREVSGLGITDRHSFLEAEFTTSWCAASRQSAMVFSLRNQGRQD